MSTTLAFRTPVGGVAIPGGPFTQLGTVDVSAYSKIRVVAFNRGGGPFGEQGVTVFLDLTDAGDVSCQLDFFGVASGGQVTRVYDIPGTNLTLRAAPYSGGGAPDKLDLLVYGS